MPRLIAGFALAAFAVSGSASAEESSRAAAADLRISKTASPNPVAAGSNLTYMVTVTNNGPQAATSVTVTDTLPGTTTFVSCAATSGGVCGGSGNNRTISFASLASGSSATITLVTTVKTSVANGGQIYNRARVASSGSADSNLSNNTASVTVTASNPKADLALTKTASPNPVRANTDLTYTVTVTNKGPQAATSVTVTDTLPGSTTFVSCAAMGGGVCGGSGNNRTISFTSLASSSSATITLVTRVKPAVTHGGQIYNKARVASSSPPDPVLTNNSASVTVTASNPKADLVITQSAAPDPVAAGSNVTYSITVANNGPQTATSVTATDTLPGVTSFVSCTATGGGVCGGSGNNRTVSFASLASGSSATITLVAAVSSSATVGLVVRNTARVSSTDTDPAPANNAATASTTVSKPGVGLSITKTAAPDPARPGSDVTYTITVANHGSQAATNLTVTDTLPTATTFVSCASTGGGVCGGQGNDRTISFSSLAAATYATITLVASLDPSVTEGTVISNTASVSSDPPDGDQNDNSATTSMTASNSEADLGLSVSAAPDPVRPGSNVTYTITVTNNGPQAASSVTVMDTLAPTTTFVSCSSSGGGLCGGSGNNRAVSFSSLASGGSGTITLIATVSSSVAEGTLIGNTVRVAALEPPDPAASNNSAGATVVVSWAPVRFLDSSSQLGVAESTETWGLAVWDWNADGCDDLYVGRHFQKPPRLYRNGCQGPFVDEVARLRLNLVDYPGSRTLDRHTPAFGDFDGDGRQDLFISAGGGGGVGPGTHDQLFHQLSDGTFENIASAQNMTDSLGSGRFGAWLDHDRDGDLDLFLGHFVQSERPEVNRNILWRNTAGNFADVAAAAGMDYIESSLSGVAADLDLDGDMDMITAPGQSGSIYRNQGSGVFSLSTLGFGAVLSVTAGDYDADGDPDLFLTRGIVSSTEFASVLLRRDGSVYTNVTSTAGVGVTRGRSALWLDVDNDGHLDLFVNRGSEDPALANLPDALFINGGNGTFTNRALAAGVTGPSDGTDESAAWGDFNRDGFLDLAVVSRSSVETVRIYLNQGNANRWITLHLLDPSSKNRAALGARVSVTAGGRTQYRQVTSGTVYESQSPAYVHVGLGNASVVDALQIRWPDGTLSTFTAVPVNAHYRATKGGSLTIYP